MDVQRNAPILKPERRRSLPGPLRARSWASRLDMARDHEAGAYKARPGGTSAALPFGLAGMAILLWWAADEGGYAPTAWYPGALLFLALLVAVVVREGRGRSLAPGAWGAIALLAGFTVWSFLSIGWAGVPGDAWDGANRTLLYLTVYATFALLPWRAPEAAVVLGLFAVGTAVVGFVALASNGAGAFNGNRLADPIGYENASAALFLMAFWPALALAARPEVHWVARGLLLAAGGALLQLALLAQSRGSILGVAVALPLLVLLSRERARLLATLLLVVVATLATLDPLLDVVAGGGEAEVERAVAREVVALALSSGALLLIGLVLAFGDRPGRPAQAVAPGPTCCGAPRQRSRARRRGNGRRHVDARGRAQAGSAERTLRHVEGGGRRARRAPPPRRRRRQLRGRFRPRASHRRGASLSAQPAPQDVFPDRARRRSAFPRLRRNRSRSCAATGPGTRCLDGRRGSRLRHRGRLLARARLDRLALGDSRSRSVRSCISRAGIRPRPEQGSRDDLEGSRPCDSPRGCRRPLPRRRGLLRVPGPCRARARTRRAAPGPTRSRRSPAWSGRTA